MRFPNDSATFLIETIMNNNEIQGVSIRQLRFHRDRRGWLAELFRQDELGEDIQPVMAYVSETLPGESRGPHEHRGQTDVFVFPGPGDLQLCLWDARKKSVTFGNRIVLTVGESHPSRVIVPPGVVHGYRNVSDRPALVFNAPNRLFAGPNRSEEVDEIRHETDPNSPFTFESEP